MPNNDFTNTPQEIDTQLGAFLDNLIEGVQIIDFEHRYLYVNNAAIKQNKFSKEQLIGKTQMEMYPGIDKTEVFKTMDACLKTKRPQRIENEFKFPDDSTGWFEVRSEPVIYGAMILSLDITDTKRTKERVTEEALQKTKATERADEAEKMNKIMIDRELRMIELKDKIARLEKELEAFKKN